jgi:hypothetical protein
MTATQSAGQMMGASSRMVGLLAAAVIALSNLAGAQQSVTQRVVFQVVGHREASASQISAPLAVGPTSASVSTGRLTILTNEANQKISASLDHTMPAGTALSMSIASSNDATGSAATSLGTSETDVVTTLPASKTTALPIVYELTGAHRAARGEHRQVVFTIAAGA